MEGRELLRRRGDEIVGEEASRASTTSESPRHGADGGRNPSQHRGEEAGPTCTTNHMVDGAFAPATRSFAGGDCVQSKNILTEKSVWQPMGSTANRQGRVIADNIAGLPTRFAGVVGTAILKLFHLTIGKTGLNEEQGRAAGFDPVSVIVEEPDRPHFMPGMGAMTIRLVADRRSRRVIGAQFMGNGVVDKRLDSIVAAISSGMTVDMLADADFAYAPPFATALDPTTHAANTLRNKMDGLVRTYSPAELKARMERLSRRAGCAPQELD